MLLSVSRSASDADYAHVYVKTVSVESFRELAQIVCGERRWSPIVWEGGHRRQDGFQSAELVVLDFDDGRMTIDDAVAHFSAEGVRFMIGPTRSHGLPKSGSPAQDRFRVVLQMDAPLTHLPRYKQNMRRIIEGYPADRACGDGARIYRPCTKIIAAKDGDLVQMLPYQEPPPVDKSRFISMHLLGRLPKWVEEVLGRDCPGARNATVFRVSARLATYGYSESDIRRIIFDSSISLSDAEKESAIGSGIRSATKTT